MENNNNLNSKKKLQLKKEVITILQKEHMAKVMGGLALTTVTHDLQPSECAGSCDTTCGGKKCVSQAD